MRIPNIRISFRHRSGVLFYVLILAGFILGGVLHSCKKDNSVIPIDPRLKAGFNFQPGTYWIYRDSISGRIDSFFVRNNVSGNAAIGSSTPEQTILISILDYPISPVSLTDTTLWILQLYNSQLGVKCYNPTALTRNGKNIDYGPLFSLPFVIGYTDDFEGIPNNLIDTYKTYQIGINSYVDVAVIQSIAESTADSMNMNNIFVIVPGTGFVDIKISQPWDSVTRNFELQRCNIVL